MSRQWRLPGVFPRRPWHIVPWQQDEGRWGFWITAPNHATVARSCRYYTTKAGAINAAARLMDGWRRCGIEVVGE